VPDHKPPRSAAGESETLRALLQYERDSLIRKVAGIDDSAARQSPVETGTSLFWLIKHSAWAELTWVPDRFAGQDLQMWVDRSRGVQTLSAAVDFYRAVWREVDTLAFGEAADLEALCRNSDTDEPVNLRWVLAHLVEETARHAGHADILRELLDGETGR
jgi:hypothetical protein